MITVHAPTGIGEVRAGDDIAQLVDRAGLRADLRDGDVLVVTSKVVSKAEGRVVPGTPERPADRAAAVAAESDRVVARRGGTAIVRTRHGLVMAAAGVDASNTEPGSLVLLPLDPDRSARRLREALAESGGPNVAVVVSDTAGRAWRNGQTDIAVGAAGLMVVDDHAGRVDAYGNELSVTAPAVADEVAAAADLVMGKLSGCPVAGVRGLARAVLPRGEQGPGARALVREAATDMFGLGSREAVTAALRRGEPAAFGRPVPAEELAAVLVGTLGARLISEAPQSPDGRLDGAEVVVEVDAPDERALGACEERAVTLAFAHGWQPTRRRQATAPTPGRSRLGFVPATP